MLTLIWNILKDEAGIAPLALGAIAMGAGGLMSALGGEDEEIYDPLAEERKKYTGYISGKLGQKTPYQYNPAFEIPQPGVERETESAILGRLRKPPTVSGFSKDITDKYKGSLKQAAQEDWQKGVEEEKNMYNRLGLASSTPWLTRFGEKQGDLEDTFGEIENRFAYEDIGREIEANKLVSDITNQNITQGQVLGGAQRGYNQFPIQQSFADIIRQTGEEQAWAQMLQNYLMGQPAERTLRPDLLSQLGGTLTNIGSLGMRAGMAGAGR